MLKNESCIRLTLVRLDRLPLMYYFKNDYKNTTLLRCGNSAATDKWSEILGILFFLQIIDLIEKNWLREPDLN